MFSFNNTGDRRRPLWELSPDKLGAHSLTRLTDAYAVSKEVVDSAGAVRPFTALTPCVVRVNTYISEI